MSKPANADRPLSQSSDTPVGHASGGTPHGGADATPILERVQRLRGGTAGAHASIQVELMKEKASSYGRAVAKVEGAYRALEKAEAALDDPDATTSLLDRRARYEAAHATALRARWELVVHREAVGFYRSDDLDRDFPVPRRRR